MTAEAARVLRAYQQSRSLKFSLFGGLAGIATIGLAASGGTSALTAFPVGVIAATLVALGWSTWSRAREDLRRGMIVRASGTIGLTDKTTSSEFNRRVCTLIVGDSKLQLANAAADSVRSRSGSIKVKETRNLFAATSDELAFAGTVEYAPRSSLVLKIHTAGGRPVWQHPGFTPHQPRLVTDSVSGKVTQPPTGQWDGSRMVFASMGVGCVGYGVMLMLLVVFVFSLGDYPSLSVWVSSSLLFGAFAVAGLAVLGAALARLNPDWWLRAPLIAAWPVYLLLLFSAVSSLNQGGDALHNANNWLLTIGIPVAAVGITIAASLIARRLPLS
jgi:hypothetical protein